MRSMRAAHRRLPRFLDLARTLGLPRAITIAAQWPFRREYVVLVRDLQATPAQPPAHEPLQWTPLSETATRQLSALNPAMTDKEIRRRWREGQVCLVAWHGEVPVHYRWETASPTWLPMLGKVFRPLEGDTIIVDIFTHPAFRSRGITSAGMVMGWHRAKQQGCRRSIGLVAWWNAPSLRVGQQTAGRLVAGRVGYWTAGLGRHYFATGTVRFDERGGVYVLPKASPTVYITP